MRVGLISDTHGMVRSNALDFLRGCDRIIHGGDIGGPAILEQLNTIAPVTAVRGNNDTGSWAQGLNAIEIVDVQEVRLYAIHNLAEITIDPATAGVRVVISGHSHKPRIEERAGVLFVNPGSAGPRRFKLPIALGELMIERASVTARYVELDDRR
jgi:putative phosphoesterase